MKTSKRIRNIYSQENTTIQEKAVSLFILNSLLCVGFLALGALRLFSGSLLLGSMEVVVSLVLIVFVAALLRGSFKAISMGTIILFSLAAAGLFFLREITGGKDIYIQSTYMIPAFITAPLLAYTRWQVVGVVVFGLVTHTGQFLLRVRPAALAAGGTESMVEFLVSLLLMLFSGMFIYQLFMMQHRSLETIEDRAAKRDEEYRKLTKLLDTTGDAFNLGERLQGHAKRNSDHATSIAERLEKMNESLSGLSEGMRATKEASGDIGQSTETVKNRMQRQTDAMQESSAAVEQIEAQSKSIAESARSKNTMIGELVAKAREGETQLDRAIEIYRKIESSSNDMLEVIQLIEDIAERTNLLAMNAAIEAAHAGDSGRGFAVVASEIRGLAKEANDNSRTIRSTLEDNRELIKESVETSDEMQSKFRQVITTVTSVRDALQEMIASMSELDEGHARIRATTDSLSEINTEVHDSIGSMEGNIDVGMQGIGRIDEAVHLLESQIEGLNTLSTTILQEAETLQQTGEENIENYRKLQADMRDLSG
jgi:methyl-accepting chemotaxis protein